MKVWDKGQRLWARFVASAIAGEGVNTILFYGIALRTVLPQRVLLMSILLGWAAKVLVEVILLPVSYAVVRSLKKSEGVDHYDSDTNFNPFYFA
jgi:queuosine precursor transporter